MTIFYMENRKIEGWETWQSLHVTLKSRITAGNYNYPPVAQMWDVIGFALYDKNEGKKFSFYVGTEALWGNPGPSEYYECNTGPQSWFSDLIISRFSNLNEYRYINNYETAEYSIISEKTGTFSFDIINNGSGNVTCNVPAQPFFNISFDQGQVISYSPLTCGYTHYSFDYPAKAPVSNLISLDHHDEDHGVVFSAGRHQWLIGGVAGPAIPTPDSTFDDLFVSCYLVGSAGGFCAIDTSSPHTDEKWTFMGTVTYGTTIYEDSIGGRFNVNGGPLGSLTNVWLCSNDCLWDRGPCVILRTREGEYFLTRSTRINMGKYFDRRPHDLNCKMAKWLRGKLCSDCVRLDPVSTGIIQASDSAWCTVSSQIGQIIIPNFYGSAFPKNTKVVILNTAEKNNFARVIGPAKEL